jgi:hypothetical protein
MQLTRYVTGQLPFVGRRRRPSPKKNRRPGAADDMVKVLESATELLLSALLAFLVGYAIGTVAVDVTAVPVVLERAAGAR